MCDISFDYCKVYIRFICLLYVDLLELFVFVIIICCCVNFDGYKYYGVNFIMLVKLLIFLDVIMVLFLMYWGIKFLYRICCFFWICSIGFFVMMGCFSLKFFVVWVNVKMLIEI